MAVAIAASLGTGIAVSTSVIVTCIVTIILSIGIIWFNTLRDKNNNMRIREEIKRAEKQIIKVILEGDRRKQPRS